uniref:Mastadenovirus sus4 E3 region, pVIII n=1 Tax=Porcine adenovirus B serotype 4 TaxID=35267 RepID=Q64849_ADEP4|nr:ORF2 [Porcine adenovirus 4]
MALTKPALDWWGGPWLNNCTRICAPWWKSPSRETDRSSNTSSPPSLAT